MATISNTVAFQFASMAKANHVEAGRAISNRNAKPLEQTSSSQAGSVAAAKTCFTYAHLGQQFSQSIAQKPLTQGVNSLSSLSTAFTSSKAGAKPPANNYAQMGAFKDLVGHYQGASDRYAGALVDRAARITQDPKTGERHFVNDGKNHQTPRVKTGELFELSLTTKDGDRIEFSISADYLASLKSDEPDAGRLETAFAFGVEGTLSDKERAAVNDLVTRLSGIAKDYDQRGWANVDFLDAFNSDALASVDFTAQGDEGKSLAVSYSLDTVTGTHSLAVNQDDYEYAISAGTTLDETGFALQDNRLYQQLQQALIDTNQAYKPGEFLGGVSSSKAADFFLNGLEAIFTPVGVGVNAHQKPLTDKLDNPADKAITASDNAGGHLGASQLPTQVKADAPATAAAPDLRPIETEFLSGLPDFTASFNTPRLTPNASNSGEVSQMSLTLAQATAVSVKSSDGVKTLDQRYRFEATVSQHFGIGGDSMEHANLADRDKPGGQTYQYEVLKQSVSLARSMTLDGNGRVASYQEDKHSEHTQTTKKVVNGVVESQDKKDLSDPKDTYSRLLQVTKSPSQLATNAIQVKGYQDMQILKEAIKSQHINLYL